MPGPVNCKLTWRAGVRLDKQAGCGAGVPSQSCYGPTPASLPGCRRACGRRGRGPRRLVPGLDGGRMGQGLWTLRAAALGKQGKGKGESRGRSREEGLPKAQIPERSPGKVGASPGTCIRKCPPEADGGHRLSWKEVPPQGRSPAPQEGTVPLQRGPRGVLEAPGRVGEVPQGQPSVQRPHSGPTSQSPPSPEGTLPPKSKQDCQAVTPPLSQAVAEAGPSDGAWASVSGSSPSSATACHAGVNAEGAGMGVVAVLGSA